MHMISFRVRCFTKHNICRVKAIGWGSFWWFGKNLWIPVITFFVKELLFKLLCETFRKNSTLSSFSVRLGMRPSYRYCLPVVWYYILLHQKKRAVQAWGVFVVAPSAIHHLFPTAAVGALLLWLQITIQRLVADLLSSCRQVSLPLKLHNVDSFFHFSFG